MDIIICGGGEIGGSVAEAMVKRGDNVTVIDTCENRLAYLEEHYDIAVLHGGASSAETLRTAGAGNADAVIAATGIDEVNLVCTTVAASLGAGRTLARVNHSLYLSDNSDVDYARLFSVDRLFSPDRATARAIAARLSNPGALAVERFARGTVEMQSFVVDAAGSAADCKLRDVPLPRGARVLAIRRGDKGRLATADTRMKPGDRITVVVDTDRVSELDGIFTPHRPRRRDVAIAGGSPTAVWVCRALQHRGMRIRLFETDMERAEDLAGKLDWVSVIHADPTAPEIFEDQNITEVDAFLALGEDDMNLLSSALAKRGEVPLVIAMTHRPGLKPLMEQLQVTEVFNPRDAAREDIVHFISDAPLERLGPTLASGQVELFRIRVGPSSPLAEQPLRQLGPDAGVVVAVAEDESERGHVPGPDDVLAPGRHVLLACEAGREKHLRKLFGL
ncbi:MAG: Trk system potassium transporter TrkA [Phycisphaerales bacterium]|nr:Trk system potassium transporter TrkA [Phycisphaerales bacterium]